MPIKTNRLISLKVAMYLTSLSRSEIARKEMAGEFPQRVALSPHPRGRKAFLESEVLDWVWQRISERSSD